jgi:uncharacterized protein (TIGR02118 family)
VPYLAIYYPNRDGARFDFDHYLHRHLPMTARWFGDGITLTRGTTAADGTAPPPYICVLRIPIASLDAFMEVWNVHGAELSADIPNYTDVEPVIQVEEDVPLRFARRQAAHFRRHGSEAGSSGAPS